MAEQVPFANRFKVLEELESSGRMRLLRCFDRTVQREVLLQVLRSPQSRTKDGDRDRLLREARMMARVNHPNIARLFEVLEDPAGPVLVLQPSTGESLMDRLERLGKLSSDDVRRLGSALSEAMAVVHGEGVVHRGIGESNIHFQDNDEILLSGFEFSKPLDLSISGTSLDFRSFAQGLPRYPAPEQLLGQRANARSDIYSLGCVLYHALTGRAPMDSSASLSWAEPPDPGSLEPSAPKDLVDTIRRCIAEKPLARFQSMRDVSAALRVDATPPERAPNRSHRRRWLSVGAAAVVVAGVLIGLRAFDRPAQSDRGRLIAPASTEQGGYKAAYDNSHALLIGIDYRGATWSPLQNAERDVLAIEGRLKALGWRPENVTVLRGKDATRRKMRVAIQSLLREAGKDDQVFIYYAGHGVGHDWAEEIGWAVPYDGGKSPAEGISGDNWFELDKFTAFNTTQAKHVLVALDCCHGGAAAMRGVDARALRFKQSHLTRRARKLIASSRSSELANDGVAGKHSPFAQAFLDMLDRARGEAITSTRIFVAAQDSLAGTGQAPAIKDFSDGASDFVFLPPPDEPAGAP